jgi:hypothetical protein
VRIEIIALCAVAATGAFCNSVASFAQDTRARATAISGDCQTTAQKFVVSARAVNSKSNGVFLNLPEGVSFLQTKAGCVTVAFSGDVSAPAGTALQIRAMLDNSPSGQPADVFLVGMSGANNHAAHGMNFVFTGVAPGRHTLRMQLASTGANPVSLYTRSIIVSYVK